MLLLLAIRHRIEAKMYMHPRALTENILTRVASVNRSHRINDARCDDFIVTALYILIWQ